MCRQGERSEGDAHTCSSKPNSCQAGPALQHLLYRPIFHLKPSALRRLPGHWPYVFFTVSNVCLFPGSQQFEVSEVNENEILKKFNSVGTWQLAAGSVQVSDRIECSEIYDKAFIFTVFYWYGNSNYFHILYDTVIPIYFLMRDTMSENISKVVLMPSVEQSRMQPINWDTDAFDEHYSNRYWMQILKVCHTIA